MIFTYVVFFFFFFFGIVEEAMTLYYYSHYFSHSTNVSCSSGTDLSAGVIKTD